MWPKIVFKEITKIFGVADDILIVGYDADDTDHDRTLYKVLQIHRTENLKLNKDKCYLRCTSVPFLCVNWHAVHKIKEGIAGIPQHNKLFKHIFPGDR